MAEVTGLTAARMLEIEAASVVDGDIVGDNLILTKHDGSTIDAGNVRGPEGPVGPMAAPVEPSSAALDELFANGLPASWTAGTPANYATGSAGLKLTSAVAAAPVWRPNVRASGLGSIIDTKILVDRGQFSLYLMPLNTASHVQLNVNYAFSSGANCNIYSSRNGGATNILANGFATDYPAVGTIRWWRIMYQAGIFTALNFADDPLNNPDQDPISYVSINFNTQGSAEVKRLLTRDVFAAPALGGSTGIIIQRFRVSKP